MADDTVYIHKAHAFKANIKWSLRKDGLAWEELEKDKRSGFIPFEKMTSIRLRYEPTRYESGRVGFHIHAGRHYHMTNIDYGGVLNFVSQSTTFNPFIARFHHLIPRDQGTKFYKGSTWPAMFGNLAVLGGVLLLLLFLAPIISVTGIPGSTSIFRIILILFFLPILIRLVRRNWPKEYHPDHFPKDMLMKDS